MLNVVLYAPRIPQNTGQIARACWAAGARLHLIRPLGFRMDAAALRRAAVGYLAEMDIPIHADGDAFWRDVTDPARAWLITKHGQQAYTEAVYRDNDWLILGSETEGLPPEWLAAHPAQTLRIPMPNPAARCLNLATSAAIVLYEALRQLGPRNPGSTGSNAIKP
jgi:tRNA (cytidine/uridine-2'-O-)-methyltransferase